MDGQDDDAGVEDRMGSGVVLGLPWPSVALPPTIGGSRGPSRLAVRKPLCQLRLQFFDVASLLARTPRETSTASFTHSRSKSISYGVNIRGAGEVPSLRLSKAIEGVAEILAPPPLEVSPVLLSELMELPLRNVQLGGVGLTSQSDRANDLACILLDPASQIGQGAALPDEVIHQAIVPGRTRTRAGGRSGLPRLNPRA